jgi:predicted HTH transcriptional regulator
MEKGQRVDDTPIHGALREALANSLINADYYGEGGVVIKSGFDKITFENPGTLRIKTEEAISGGLSSPRNAALMKMFNLLDIGERAGSGIPNIFFVWEKQGLGTPQICENFESIERTAVLLPIKEVPITNTDKKIPIKSTDKSVPITSTDKTAQQKEAIIDFMRGRQNVKSADLLAVLGVKEERVKKLMQQLVAEKRIVAEGANRNRTYRLP